MKDLITKKAKLLTLNIKKITLKKPSSYFSPSFSLYNQQKFLHLKNPNGISSILTVFIIMIEMPKTALLQIFPAPLASSMMVPKSSVNLTLIKLTPTAQFMKNLPQDMVFHGSSLPLSTIAKPAFVATTQPMVKVFISFILTLAVATIAMLSLILVKFPKLNFRDKLTLWPSSYKIITAPA